MKQGSVKVNFIMNALLTMSSILFPLITFPYVSRILMPDGMGKISFATSIVSYFNLFAQLGIPIYGVRACAKVRDKKIELSRITHEIFFINMLMSLFSFMVLVFTIFFVPRFQEEKVLYLIIGTTIFFNTIGMEWFYRALEKYTYITIRSLIFKVIALVAMFLLIQTKEDYVIYGGITVFASCMSNICNIVNIHKYIYVKPVGGYNFGRHIKAVIVFFAMSCATTIYTNLDTVMLGFMTSDAEVGYYNAAVKIKTVLVSVITSLGTVLLPRLSYYIENEMTLEFSRLTKKSINYIFCTAIPLVVFFIFFSENAILFLAGANYLNAVFPMRVIMPTVLLIGLTNVLGIQILVPKGREGAVLLSEVAGAVVNMIVNVLLIPIMAALGAAIGTLLAEAVVLIVQIIVMRNEIYSAFKEVAYLKILGSVFLALIGTRFVVILNMNYAFTLVVAFVIYISIYGISLYCMKEKMILDLVNQVKKRLIKGGMIK